MIKRTVLHFTHIDLDAIGCDMVVRTGLSDKYKVFTFFCGNSNVDSIITGTLTNVLEGKPVTASIVNDEHDMICNAEEEVVSIYDLSYIIISDIGPSIDTINFIKKYFSHLIGIHPYDNEDELYQDKYDHVLLFDHHKTNPAIGMNESWIRIVPDKIEIPKYNIWFTIIQSYYNFEYNIDLGPMLVSATYLCMEYFSCVLKSEYMSDILLAHLVTCISLYDTWEWKKYEDYIDTYKITKLANVCSVIGANKLAKYFNILFLAKLFNSNHVKERHEFLLNVAGLFEVTDAIFEKSLSKAPDTFRIHKESNDDLVGIYIVHTDINISTFGDELYKQYNCMSKLKYVAYIFPASQTISFRSRGDVDVSEIAKGLGGGGHKNAAGVRIDSRLTFITWLVKYYDSESLKSFIENE